MAVPGGDSNLGVVRRSAAGRGDPALQNGIMNQEMNKLLTVALEFRRVARRAIDAMPVRAVPGSAEGVLSVTTQFLTSAIYGSFEAILLLCREGWGVESDVLLRQLQEAVVNARAMRRSTTTLFLYAEEVERRANAVAGKSRDPKLPDALLPTRIFGTPPRTDKLAWHQTGSRKGRRRYWRDLSMETRVELADLDTSVWYGLYRKLCPVLHAGPGGMVAYLHEDYWGTLWFGPNWKRAFRSLVSACALLFVHLGTLGVLFRLDLGKDLAELARQLEGVVPLAEHRE